MSGAAWPSLCVAASLALTLFCAGASAGGEKSGADGQEPLAYGGDLFAAWCSNCHAGEPGAAPFAAPLEGLFGRKAGTYSGYEYTARITSLDLIWSAETLDGWLAGLATESPTTSIRHLGIANPKDRTALAAYVASLAAE